MAAPSVKTTCSLVVERRFFLIQRGLMILFSIIEYNGRIQYCYTDERSMASPAKEVSGFPPEADQVSVFNFYVCFC
jgi:hypothetical protein